MRLGIVLERQSTGADCCWEFYGPPIHIYNAGITECGRQERIATSRHLQHETRGK
jgi:hypothetical protein